MPMQFLEFQSGVWTEDAALYLVYPSSGRWGCDFDTWTLPNLLEEMIPSTSLLLGLLDLVSLS